MKYSIVYLIKGKAETYHQKAVYDLGNKFGVETTINQKVPSHITFKYLSDRKKIKDIEKILDELSKKIDSSNFILGGTGNFGKNVIYFKVEPSRQMVLFRSNLLKELKKLKDVRWNSWDKNSSKFHATITEKDIGNKFKEIKSYLFKYNKKFNLKFDSITIIKKPKDKWIIHKEFKIK
jgi:2'-5' RNA ligase